VCDKRYKRRQDLKKHERKHERQGLSGSQPNTVLSAPSFSSSMVTTTPSHMTHSMSSHGHTTSSSMSTPYSLSPTASTRGQLPAPAANIEHPPHMPVPSAVRLDSSYTTTPYQHQRSNSCPQPMLPLPTSPAPTSSLAYSTLPPLSSSSSPTYAQPSQSYADSALSSSSSSSSSPPPTSAPTMHFARHSHPILPALHHAPHHQRHHSYAASSLPSYHQRSYPTLPLPHSPHGAEHPPMFARTYSSDVCSPAASSAPSSYRSAPPCYTEEPASMYCASPSPSTSSVATSGAAHYSPQRSSFVFSDLPRTASPNETSRHSWPSHVDSPTEEYHRTVTSYSMDRMEMHMSSATMGYSR
jgi:hypothetical protein